MQNSIPILIMDFNYWFDCFKATDKIILNKFSVGSYRWCSQWYTTTNSKYTVVNYELLYEKYHESTRKFTQFLKSIKNTQIKKNASEPFVVSSSIYICE